MELSQDSYHTTSPHARDVVKPVLLVSASEGSGLFLTSDTDAVVLPRSQMRPLQPPRAEAARLRADAAVMRLANTTASLAAAVVALQVA